MADQRLCHAEKLSQTGLSPLIETSKQLALLSATPAPHIPLPQLLKQPPKTSPVKRLVVMQHAPDFFHQCRANHLHGLLPRISCRQEALERLPRLGWITGTNLVLDHLQDRRLQVRIEWRFLIIRLVDSSGLSA